jgi:hypothetical protein
MKISELKLNSGRHYVQTKTDALRIVSNKFDVDRYIFNFGDVEIEQDSHSGLAVSATHWLVPEFADDIRVYTENKMVQCQRWGCE